MLILWGFNNFYGVGWGGGGGGSQKNNIYGELPKKGGLENLQKAWQKIGQGGLWGVDTLMCTMTIFSI